MMELLQQHISPDAFHNSDERYEPLEEAGLLAAAFFFSRNATGRNDKTPLVATLVRLDLGKCAASSSHHRPALLQHCAVRTCLQNSLISPQT